MSLRAIFVTGTLSVLFLAGCSHWPTPVVTWEGEGSEQTAAMLRVPGHLQLMQVDGRSVPDYLAQSASFDYLLLPGERSLTVRYDSLWAGGLAGNAQRVTSAPLELEVTVREGEKYRLSSALRPDTISRARSFAGCPELWFESAAGELLARAQPALPCSAED